METLLDRSIGAESHRSSANENTGESDYQTTEIEAGVVSRSEVPTRWRSIIASIGIFSCCVQNADESNDRTPLLGPHRRPNSENIEETEVKVLPEVATNVSNAETPQDELSNRETISIGLKMFTSISAILNIIYLVLSIIVSVGKKWNNQSQHFSDVYTQYCVVYYSFLTICCVVGILSSRRLKRQQHSHVSFLEYLLLFATSGVFFQSAKRVLAFGNNNKSLQSYITVQLLSAYYMEDLLDLIQVISQIVFYYYVKDVKPQLTCNSRNAHRSRICDAVFKNIIFVTCTSNFAIWAIDSFLYPDMTAVITPAKQSVIETWKVFDNITPPIYIFFRFNSMLLFGCIYTDISSSATNRN